jgi:hypothetical protein
MPSKLLGHCSPTHVYRAAVTIAYLKASAVVYSSSQVPSIGAGLPLKASSQSVQVLCIASTSFRMFRCLGRLAKAPLLVPEARCHIGNGQSVPQAVQERRADGGGAYSHMPAHDASREDIRDQQIACWSYLQPLEAIGTSGLGPREPLKPSHLEPSAQCWVRHSGVQRQTSPRLWRPPKAAL